MANPLYLVEVVTTTQEINYHKLPAKSASDARRKVELELRGKGEPDSFGNDSTATMIFPDVMSEKKRIRKTHLWTTVKDQKREFAR